MANEGTDQSIDSAQGRLERQRQQEKDKGLADIVRQYGDTFFKEVDGFQAMSPEVKSAEAQKYFAEGKGEVSAYLMRLAARGQWLLDHPDMTETDEEKAGKAEKGKDKKPVEKKESGKKDSVKVPKESEDNMTSLAIELKSALGKYRENLKVIVQVDQNIEQAQKENEQLAKLEKDKKSDKDLTWQIDRTISVFAQAKKSLVDSPNLPVDYNGKQMSLVEKNLASLVEKRIALEQKKFPDEDPAVVKARVMESVDAQSCPKIMEQYFLGLRMFDKGKMPEAKAALEQFRDKDLKSSAFQDNKKLKAQEGSYLEKVQSTLDQIEGFEKGNKDFFDGARLMDEQDFIGAKAAFKKFLAEHENDKIDAGKPDLRIKAKVNLRNIALLQVADVRLKFAAVPKPTAGKLVDAGGGKLMDSGDLYDSYVMAIGEIEQLIRSGKFTDYTDAYNEVMKGKKIPSDVDFNFLSDEASLDKGKPQLLELARKYRENKRYDLAEQAYMQYLSQHMGKLVEKDQSLSYEGFLRKYDSSPKVNSAIQNRINDEKEKYDEKAAKLGQMWVAHHPWNEAEIRTQMWKEAYSQMLPSETQNRQAEIAGMGQASFDSPEAKQAWEELASMKGLNNKGTWKEPFTLSDEQILTVIATVPLLFARAPGGAVGGLMRAESTTLSRVAMARGLRGGLTKMAKLGALGLTAGAALEGCTTYAEFFANFDMREYESFSEGELKQYEGDYEELNEESISGKLATQFVANTIAQETGLKLDFSKLYSYYFYETAQKAGETAFYDKAPHFKDQNELLTLIKSDLPDAKITNFSASGFTFTSGGKEYKYSVDALGPAFEDVSQKKYMTFDLENSMKGTLGMELFKDHNDYLAFLENKSNPSKTYKISPNGITFITDKATGATSFFTKDKPNEIQTIRGYQDLIDFLDKQTNAAGLSGILKNISIRDIQSVEQLREIAKRLPPNSKAFRDLVKGSISYAKNDNGSSDEYRSPIDTLRSGWGDCDDYSVLNAFWAYMRGYKTRVIKIHSDDDDARAPHVFVVYTDGKTGNAFVLDVDRVTPLASADENGINAYLNFMWPTYGIDYDNEGGIMLVAPGRPDSLDKTHHEEQPKKKVGTSGDVGKGSSGGSPKGGEPTGGSGKGGG